MAEIVSVRVPGDEYGGTVVLDEYNGEYSLVAANEGKDGKVWKRWAFPQTKDKKPRDKALPVKVSLGRDQRRAVGVLKAIIAAIEGRAQGTPDTGSDDSSIPF